MRINNIQIQGLDQRYVILRRARGTEILEAEVITPEGTELRQVATGDSDAIRALAVFLHEALEGYRGTNGDIQDYLIPLQLMACD